MNKQVILGGPMFENDSDEWVSIHRKSGGHYKSYALRSDDLGMRALRKFFPDGKADERNLCVFSTSGVHGTSITIEECEDWVINGSGGDDEGVPEDVTFLIIQPRICCLRHGNCKPKNESDFAFLKCLRESSRVAFASIGGHGSIDRA